MTSVSRASPAIATTKGNTDLYNAILPGLRSSPKYTPHWYNYDKRGSELFHISANRNPHYHIYQVESSLLNRYADDIVSPYGEGSIIADLGAGDCSKPRILIEALLKKNGTCTFYPVDVAKEFVEENSRRLIDEYPGLEVHPLAGENQHGLKYLQGFAEPSLSLISETVSVP
ncbi:histidine N-alpha-methyltransferase-like [Ptychodera flava]|uniref:histidine N-alpha-methyltransferase-like n=1 Tax=Ptychodera flava TaxID=63121 RepID=UPI003969C8D1